MCLWWSPAIAACAFALAVSNHRLWSFDCNVKKLLHGTVFDVLHVFPVDQHTLFMCSLPSYCPETQAVNVALPLQILCGQVDPPIEFIPLFDMLATIQSQCGYKAQQSSSAIASASSGSYSARKTKTEKREQLMCISPGLCQDQY